MHWEVGQASDSHGMPQVFLYSYQLKGSLNWIYLRDSAPQSFAWSDEVKRTNRTLEKTTDLQFGHQSLEGLEELASRGVCAFLLVQTFFQKREKCVELPRFYHRPRYNG